jgi:hypothetical protein
MSTNNNNNNEILQNVVGHMFSFEPEQGLRTSSLIALCFAWFADLGATVPTYNTPLCFFAVLCSAINNGFPIALLTVLSPTSIVFDIIWCSEVSTSTWVLCFVSFLIFAKLGLFFFSFRCMLARGVTLETILTVRDVRSASSNYSDLVDSESSHSSRNMSKNNSGVDL